MVLRGVQCSKVSQSSDVCFDFQDKMSDWAKKIIEIMGNYDGKGRNRKRRKERGAFVRVGLGNLEALTLVHSGS